MKNSSIKFAPRANKTLYKRTSAPVHASERRWGSTDRWDFPIEVKQWYLISPQNLWIGNRRNAATNFTELMRILEWSLKAPRRSNSEEISFLCVRYRMAGARSHDKTRMNIWTFCYFILAITILFLLINQLSAGIIWLKIRTKQKQHLQHGSQKYNALETAHHQLGVKEISQKIKKKYFS